MNWKEPTIGIIVDKSNAPKGCNQVLPPTPYLKTKKRPEEKIQAKEYIVINKVRDLLGLPMILPPTTYHGNYFLAKIKSLLGQK